MFIMRTIMCFLRVIIQYIDLHYTWMNMNQTAISTSVEDIKDQICPAQRCS